MVEMVRLAQDAYERLRSAKRPGESFSDVVRRIVPQASLLELADLGITDEEHERRMRLLAEVDELDRTDAARRWAA